MSYDGIEKDACSIFDRFQHELRVLPFLLGLWIALGIRVLLLSLFQKHAMGGFYRSDPASTNVLGKIHSEAPGI